MSEKINNKKEENDKIYSQKIKKEDSKMITKEQFLKQENENEVWCLTESFLQYWKEEFNKEHPDIPKRMIYDYLPTDKEIYEIVLRMIKNNK